MQVHIDQEILLQGVSQALGAVDRKGSLPILAHCLIQTNGRGLEIAATDLEIFFQGHYQGQVSEDGGTAVQAHILHNLLKSLPKGALNSGSSEIRNWILVAGAIENMKKRWFEYQALYRQAAGTGIGVAFGVWEN